MMRPAARAFAFCFITALWMPAPAVADQHERPYRITEQREACRDYDPLRRPLYGDTHVHTGYSIDARAQDNRSTPRDAYFVKCDGETTTLGTPLVEGASVAAELVEQSRADKIVVFKKKRRKDYRRKAGHRQHQSVLRITEILTDGKAPSAKAKAKPKKAKAETPAPEEAPVEAPAEAPAAAETETKTEE